MLAHQFPEPKQWDLRGRVLIVEDDRNLGHQILRKLKDCGLEARWMNHCDEARQELSQKRYHAVIVDTFLDESTTNGMGLMAHCHTLDIPVIAVTGGSDSTITKSCLNGGVFHFLEKPFDMEELVQSLTEAWENPRCLSTLVDRYLEAHDLTETETKIAKLCLKGLSNREIAEVNSNTEKTVKFYMTVIYQKCGVRSRGEFFNSIFPT